MRKFITVRFVVLICMVFAFAGWQKNLLGMNAEESLKKEKMPKFLYYTLDGKNFTHSDLKKGARYMFVYFNPHCDICQDEAVEIINNLDMLMDIQVVMVSPNDVEDVKKFVKKYKIHKYSDQITVLHDPMDLFYKEFGANGYPNVYLYNEKKELVRYLDESVLVEEVMDIFDLELHARK
ncbi:MAG: peroxiredoxin family protein [Cytophagaceae bacterium]